MKRRKVTGGGSNQCELPHLGRAWVCGCRVDCSLPPPNWRHHHHHDYRTPNLETSEFSALPRDRGTLEIGHLSPLSRTGCGQSATVRRHCRLFLLTNIV